ncbi:unnamed protein product [Musa acuminata var. zebrina]
MASAALLNPWCLFLALLCLSTSCCNSEESTVGTVGMAMQCFVDHHIYVGCQESYRLNGGGRVDVPTGAADVFCDGPCLVETKLALDCVERTLHGFIFLNGASVMDVRFALDVGCGHTSRRGEKGGWIAPRLRTIGRRCEQSMSYLVLDLVAGDFSVMNHERGDPETRVPETRVDDYDQGSKTRIPVYLMILLTSVLLLRSI